jgi:hypothetical protein
MMLEAREILRFAEGISDLDADREEQLLSQVASSPDLRRKIAELRRNLYLVECQMPEYRPSAELLLEAEKLSRIWSSRIEAKMKPEPSKPFPLRGILLFLASFFTLLALWWLVFRP